MTDLPRNPTVLNTTVLSNFAHVDHVDLLLDLPRLVTVDVVREELEAGLPTRAYLDHALSVLDDEIPVVSPNPSAREREADLLESLDPGEAQAVAVADTANGTVVTDDGDARTIAKRHEIGVTGSIGVLVRSVENDRLSTKTADEYLKRWIDEAGFRSPARDFTVFLEE